MTLFILCKNSTHTRVRIYPMSWALKTPHDSEIHFMSNQQTKLTVPLLYVFGRNYLSDIVFRSYYSASRICAIQLGGQVVKCPLSTCISRSVFTIVDATHVVPQVALAREYDSWWSLQRVGIPASGYYNGTDEQYVYAFQSELHCFLWRVFSVSAYKSAQNITPNQHWRPRTSEDPFPYCRMPKAFIDDLRLSWNKLSVTDSSAFSKFINLHCLETNVIENTVQFDQEVRCIVVVHSEYCT